MPIAELFDGTRLDFPEDTDPSVIEKTVKRLTLERQPKAKESLLTDIQRGAESFGSSVRAGISGIFDPNKAAEEAITRQEDIQQRLGGDQSRLSKVEEAYNKRGLLSAAGTALGEIPSAIAEQVPTLATAFGGARVGAMAGAPLGPYGAVGGAIAGTFLPFFFSEYGGNIQQQAQLQKEKGEKVDVKAAKAAGFAVPMAGLEVVENFIPFGGKIVGGLFGKEVADLLKKGATKEAEQLAKEKLAKETFLPSLQNRDFGTIVKGTTRTALAEMPVEITQQMLGRVQSDQDLFSPEALREYGETAFDVALLGPLGIYGRSVNKSQARNDILKAQRVAVEKNEPQEVLLLTYDPNVEGTVIKTPIIVNQDGSTAFPKQENQFKVNPVDEFTDAGLRQAYRPERAEPTPLPPPPPRIPRAQPIVPPVLYGTEAGQVGQTVEDVNQAQMYEQIALQKQEQLLRTVTPDTLKVLGIGPSAQIFKNPVVVGADLGNPDSALAVRTELLNLKTKNKNLETQQKIDTFLQLPFFQNLPPVEVKPVKVVKAQEVKPIKTEPDLLTTGAPQNTGVIEQNRDRSKKGYIQQINEIASKPDYTQAGFSYSVTDGAPIVTGPLKLPEDRLGRKTTATFADGDRMPVQYAVVSKDEILPSNDQNGDTNKNYSPSYQGLRVVIGNGRTAGLQLGYSKGTMGDYQKELKNDDLHGVSQEVIKNIKDPLLIRVAPQEEVAKYPNIGDKGNIKATAELSVLEQAKNDANRVNLQGLEFKEDGGISQDTVNSFVQSMPVTERTNLLDNNGKPNRRAEARLEAAIFQNAYKSDELTEIAHVDTEGEAKNLINGLSEAAPDLVALGSTKDYDVRPALVEAVKMAITARRNGMSFAELAQQRDITAPDPLVYDFIEFFAQNNRSGKKIAQGLKDIVNNVSRTVNAPETDIFGETPAKKKMPDLVRESLGRPALELKQTTPEELEQAEKDRKAQQDKEDKAKKEAEEKEKQEAEKKAIAARSEGAAKDFKLGQEAEENLSGQKDLLQTPAEKNQERQKKQREANLKPLPAPPYETVKKNRKPEVVAAAYARKQGQISRAEYEEYVEEYAPFGKVEKPAGPATNEAMYAALPSNKKDKLNVPVANGTKVYLRMDINALERGASVVSIHTNNDIEKMPASFTSTGHIKNVVFNPRNENTALSIAAGKQSKKPLQTADGTWVNTPPNETYTKVMGLINDPNWTQVSVDPLRHSYFYDRGTGQPVVSADEMYQVGRFLLAKNVKYGNKEEFLYSKGFMGDIVEPSDQKYSEGRIAYKNGDYGLIETINPKGEVVYKPMYKNNMPLPQIEVDAKDYIDKSKRNGWIEKFIPLDVADDLLAATKFLKQQAKDKHEKTPFVTYKNGIATSSSIPKDLAGVIAGWKDMLGLTGNIYVTTIEDVKKDYNNFTGSDIAARRVMANTKVSDKGVAYEVGNGNFVVAFKNLPSKNATFEVIAHEFGHVHEKQVYEKAPQAVKDALQAEHNKFLLSLKNKTGRDLIDALRARKMGKTTAGGQNIQFENVERYWKSFAEWYADQTAKWATTQEKPLTVVERFFSRLGAALRQFYQKLRNQKYLPTETFKTYMDSVTKEVGSSNFNPETIGPISTKSQQSLFAKGEIKEKTTGVAGYTPERIDSIFKYYSVSGRPTTAKAYIAYINPIDFVNATTTKDMRKTLEKEVTKLDPKKLAEEYQEIYLDIDLINGKAVIKQHEGRHRMLALANAGIEQVPVVINTRDWNSKAEVIDYLDIKGQKFNSYDKDGKPYPESGETLSVKNLIPISGEYQQYAKDMFSENNSDLQFALDSMDGVDPQYAEQLNARFGPTKKSTIKEKFAELKPNFFDRLITGLFDEFHAIKKYSQDAYMKAVLSKSIDGGLDGLLMQGQVYIKDGALDIRQGTKGLLEIMRPLGTDVERYQVWKALNRDAEVARKYDAWKALAPKDRGKEPASPSFPAAEVARRDELLKGDVDGKPRARVYRTALNEENALNRSVLDVAKQQGIIDQAAYDRFSNDIYYIPFYKQMEDGQIVSVQDSSKLTGQYFSKALKGGEKEKMGDLMENTLRNWSHILSASMKNAAANSTLKSAENLKAAVQVKSTYEGKDVITTMIDGKKAYFAVNDPALVESISLISFLGPKSPFLDVAKGFTNALRFGVTLSPGYKIRNLFRDTIASAAISPVGLNVLDNVQRGLKLSDRGNPTFVSALAGGGVFELGAAHEGDQAALVKRLIAKGVKKDTILTDASQIKNILVDMYERYNEFGNRFENANRLALYQKMIDEGKTHLEASFAARDLLNFTGQGSFRAVKLVSQLVPFFNTRLQGIYKLGRDGVTPTYRVLCNMTTGKPIEESDKLKAQRFSIVSSAVMLASMGLYMAYEDDEDFKKREDWDRDNFWWFRVGDTAYRLPKPFEIGALGTIAERSLEQIRDENVEGKVFYDRMRAIISDTLSLNPTPQFVKPLIDLYANKDSFTGAPIETSGMERLSKQERVSNNTSELAKALGGISSGAAKILTLNPEAQGVSPVQMDYAIKAYFGWLGSTVASVSDKAVQPWSDVEKPGKPALDQYALGFAKELPEAQSKYVTNFYDNSNRINQAFADMKRYAEQGEMEKVAEILAEKGDLIALEKVYNQTTDQLATYRKYINYITNNKDMPKEDKENEIIRIKVLISQVAENAENLRKSMKK